MHMNFRIDAMLEEFDQIAMELLWQFKLDQQRAFEPLGVSPMQAFALRSIAQGIDQPSGLVQIMEASPSGVSQLLAGLEERGWVRRELDPNNKRKVRVLLTKGGKTFLEQMNQRWREISRERFARLDAEEIAMLIRSFRRLLDPQAVEQ